jgi:beta-glucosidase
MKTKRPVRLIAVLCSCFFTVALPAAEQSPESTAEVDALMQRPASADQAELQARKLMNLMTPEERFDFFCGTGFGIRGIPRLGIPPLNFADASGGLRLRGELAKTATSTGFPCPLLLAATWNPELADKYGKAVAEEFRTQGIHFILGPGMNIYRSSLNGRNFEYLGEDPFLVARLVEAYVHGAQGVNVATTIKHFLCNETETYRRSTDALVEERALQEIYLPPFKAGVDAGAWAVMTSYNLLNGEWASQNKPLVTGLLRKQLGFKNLVMTDWESTWYGTKLVASGTDLEMPKGEALKMDREKVLGTPEVDRMVTDILRTGIVSGLYELEASGKFKKPEWVEKFPEHEHLSLEVNHEGIVLLKNTGILPLKQGSGDSILVTGNMAEMSELAGGGSAHVKGYNLKNYLQAVRETFGTDHVIFNATPDDTQIRSAGAVLIFSGWKRDLKQGQNPESSPKDLVTEGESHNHPFVLPEDALIAHCAELNPRTIVTLACANGVQMEWTAKTAGIFQAFYGGQTGPDALMDLMTGKVNPSGKLPFSIEKGEKDSPAAGEEEGIKPGRSLVDPKDLASRLKKMASQFLQNTEKTECYTRDLEYKEGIFVGYRWYDSKNIEPSFPFGYGLSYTTFQPSDIRLVNGGTAEKPQVTVRLVLRNTGKFRGSEVVQVYVSDLNPRVPRPVRELKGFAKVSMDAGESKEVTINLDQQAFSFWSSEQKKWVVASGPFSIDLGFSSRDLFKKEKVIFQAQHN